MSYFFFSVFLQEGGAILCGILNRESNWTRETKTLINLIDRLTKFQSFEFEMIRLKTALEMRLLMATYIS